MYRHVYTTTIWPMRTLGVRVTVTSMMILAVGVKSLLGFIEIYWGLSSANGGDYCSRLGCLPFKDLNNPL